MKRRKKPKRKTRAAAKATHASHSGHYPRAMIRWPHGMEADPVIYPLGATDDENEQIRKACERILAK